ncbi:hypothetical protein [Alkalicoccus luteus]|uniref:Uncharacterized protein n=1 Tax=Alkalicoccus luteus TaxID=1237094 RepID=A0A969PVV3_9BACI|nr:hypothetical protein [Alkalicoccus luteus]NJP39316.1 hypothetical protein [Alkalicoccus luteus]
MLRRKGSAAAVTGFAVLIVVMGMDDLASGNEVFIMLVVYTVCITVIMLVYAIPASIAADFFAPGRRTSLALHIMFGAFFILPFHVWIAYVGWNDMLTHPMLYIGIAASIVFYGVDHMLDKRMAT